MAAEHSDHVLLEVIACTVEDACNAAAGGADRLEIVRDLQRDGLTPAIDLVDTIRQAVSIPLHIMIRCRDTFSGFTAKEIDQMAGEIRAFAQLGVEGVVLGFLSSDRGIDFETMERILDGTKNLSVTFHRAFDRVKDQQRALQELIRLQYPSRILTSGGTSSAWETRKELARLVQLAKGKITIMAGGGITAENLAPLAHSTGVREFHVGRCVRTPSTYEGVVDQEKVFLLTMIAKTVIHRRLPGAKEG